MKNDQVAPRTHAWRRSLAAIASGLLLVSTAACSSAGSAPGSDADKVKFGVFPVFVSLPVWVALEKGFFGDHGLDVEATTITTGPAMMSAVASNSIDATVIGATSVETARTSGMDLKFFAVTYPASIAHVMASNDLLAECEHAGKPFPEPLLCAKGKKIGVIGGVGTESYTTAKSALNLVGLTEKDESFVPIGGGEGGAAFLQEKSIDVQFTENTGAAAAELMGAGSTLTDLNAQGVFAEWVGSGAVASGANLESSPEKFQKISDALDDAVAWLSDPANEEEATAIFKKYSPEVSDEVASKTVAGTGRQWGSKASCAQFMNVIDWLVENGAIDPAKADKSCTDLVASTAQVSQ